MHYVQMSMLEYFPSRVYYLIMPLRACIALVPVCMSVRVYVHIMKKQLNLHVSLEVARDHDTGSIEVSSSQLLRSASSTLGGPPLSLKHMLASVNVLVSSFRGELSVLRCFKYTRMMNYYGFDDDDDDWWWG